MRIQKLLLIFCLLGLSFCLVFAQTSDNEAQQKARQAVDEKIRELEQGGARNKQPNSTAPDATPIPADKQSQNQAEEALRKTEADLKRRQAENPNAALNAQARAREELRRREAEAQIQQRRGKEEQRRRMAEAELKQRQARQEYQRRQAEAEAEQRRARSSASSREATRQALTPPAVPSQDPQAQAQAERAIQRVEADLKTNRTTAQTPPPAAPVQPPRQATPPATTVETRSQQPALSSPRTETRTSVAMTPPLLAGDTPEQALARAAIRNLEVQLPSPTPPPPVATITRPTPAVRQTPPVEANPPRQVARMEPRTSSSTTLTTAPSPGLPPQDPEAQRKAEEAVRQLEATTLVRQPHEPNRRGVESDDALTRARLAAEEADRKSREAELAARRAIALQAVVVEDPRSNPRLERAERIERANPPVAVSSSTNLRPETFPSSAPRLTAAKQQKLDELLRRYRADEVTPREYHEQRARILAEP